MVYADDTTLLASDADPVETTAILNRDFEKTSIWAEKWKVKFHADKSCSILFSTTQNLNIPPLIFNGDNIKIVNKHKHLGFFLTATLDWSKQIHEVYLKTNIKLAMLRNVHYLQRKTLDLLYKYNYK